MARITFPSNKQWIGITKGEFFGNVYLTKNIDFERNTGKAVLGDTLASVANSTTLSTLTVPTQFVRTAADGTDRWWALGGKLFKSTNTDPTSTWAADAIANTPSAPLNDMKEFGSNLYVAISTDISRLVSGTWTGSWWQGTQAQPALTTNPHRFAVLLAALCITDGRYIHTWDDTIATSKALTLPSEFISEFMLPAVDVGYIGTKTTSGEEAEVFVWDRTSKSYVARYGIGDTECLAGFVARGIPYIITKKGMIKRFTGSGFTEVAFLPTVELNLNVNNIDPNGIAVNEGIVKINVDFGVSANLRVLSGIWTFNADNNNLYHSNSFVNNAGKDYSQQEVSAVGALTMTTVAKGRYLVGATAYQAYTSTTETEIYKFNDTATSGQRGYIITPKFTASQAQRFWREFIATFKNFTNSTDRIRVLYRTIESTTLPQYETITWVTSTTFTGSNANVAVGDFIEIIAGDNAGALAKITTIAAGTPKTFTIDLTLNASTNTARARYLNFKDVGTVSTQGISKLLFYLHQRSAWIQFLVELRGTVSSPELENIALDYDELPI